MGGGGRDPCQREVGRMRYSVTNAYLRQRWGIRAFPPPAAGRCRNRDARAAASCGPAHQFVPAPSGPRDRLLDVGCGSGTYMKLMRNLGWQVCGVEPDVGAVQAARRAGFDVRQGAMDELTQTLSAYSML